MSENSFESFPSQPVIPETPETAHSGFRIGQKVDFNTEIPYGEGETGEAIDTGGGWEIKDFVSRTAGDRVIESAKVVSLNGLHEDIISLTLLHGLPEAEEPTAPSAESAPEEFQLSGLPIKKRATEIISYIHAKKPHMPIIGVGGIFTAEDAYEKIKAGATLLQVYTGFIYEGPFIARSVNEGLASLLKRDGYKSISEAVGKN
jgi:hypothetical protein